MPYFRVTGPGRPSLKAAATAFACLAVLLPASLHAEEQASSGERPVISVKSEDPVKVVYQVTADATKDGVSKGLFDLKEIYDGYVRAGVNPANIKMKAVFHSKASSHLLTDEAWDEHHKATGGNPNTALIVELTRRGVDLELCDLARIGNEWDKTEIHPNVTLVGNAYHRLAELQTQGYTYVKF